jgi:hypothetical protein
LTEVTIKQPEATDTQAHIDAMVAKAEGRAAPVAETTAAERPAWLPEGFNTPEELAAAYAATKAPKAAETTAAPVTPEATTEAAAGAVEAAGLNMATLETKFLETGALEDADYAALEKAGISKAMVDGYIEGQKALGEALTGRIHAHVGGAEVFDSIVSWAAEGGLTAAEAEAFNSVVDTGNEAQLKMALDGLKAKYDAAGNSAPKFIGGGKGSATADVYASVAQMMADMSDPRYSRDPAFRADVEAKLSRSSIM